MKEQIKMYGVCSEIFEDDLVPFVGKILKNITVIVREEASDRLHSAISETIGSMVFFLVDKLDSQQDAISLFEGQFLKTVFQWVEKSSNKQVQSCGIQCLSKIILNCPDEVLLDSLEQITDKLGSILKMKGY